MWDQLLENPGIHNFVQKVLILGRTNARKNLEEFIKKNCNGKILDLGCGTGRYNYLFESNYFGLDINEKYLINISKDSCHFVCGNATILPFKNNTFDSVLSVGFFHHIDFENTKKVFQEIIRVIKKEAKILIIDAFYPDSKCDILGYMLMKLDRGCYARYKENFIKDLQKYFNIVEYQHIDGSYPYNLYGFILKIRK